MNKRVVIIGGGTFSPVRAHLSLCAPAFGETARQLAIIAERRFPNMDINLVLTKMADPTSKIMTTQDLSEYVNALILDNTVKVVFFNAAVCDFDGTIGDVQSDPKAERLQTLNGNMQINITPSEKIVQNIRKTRKDIFLVAFKTTCNDDRATQFAKGLNLLKKSSANLVVVNDIGTRENMIITPEEGVYCEHDSRISVLTEVVNMAFYRSHLSFTRSTVVDGVAVKWDDERIPANLRDVVNYCVQSSAYKEFNGATTGHFATKLTPNHFLTSIRKTNFNNIDKLGLVSVTTDGPDNVISYGFKPSVGGQSQRIIFNSLPNLQSIVHFHCPLKVDHVDDIPVVSQYEYECGSHECGTNTANGLKQFGDIYAVMLDNHGPNIVFSENTKTQDIIEFIDRNFDLDKSTSGFQQVYFKGQKSENHIET